MSLVEGDKARDQRSDLAPLLVAALLQHQSSALQTMLQDHQSDDCSDIERQTGEGQKSTACLPCQPLFTYVEESCKPLFTHSVSCSSAPPQLWLPYILRKWISVMQGVSLDVGGHCPRSSIVLHFPTGDILRLRELYESSRPNDGYLMRTRQLVL